MAKEKGGYNSLEPSALGNGATAIDTCVLSIAISLKRIADAAEKQNVHLKSIADNTIYHTSGYGSYNVARAVLSLDKS